jgi:benzoyl-CoA reductase/2-hydroxyglutaryl-CoA dehydratase subunit BcrC/BadD/HgdB
VNELAKAKKWDEVIKAAEPLVRAYPDYVDPGSAYELLADYHNVYIMELPQMKRDRDKQFWRDEVREFMTKVEELTGNKITEESLRAAIKEVNDKRRALMRIAQTRKADPVAISGKDALLSVQVAFYDDIARFTQQVNAIADECEQRVADGVGAAPKGAKRVLVTGTPMAIPNWKIHDIVEKAGGVVVQEELCTGSRYYDKLVPESDTATMDEMIDQIADKLLDINCACFTPNEARTEDVLRMAKEYNADGILHYALSFCGPYQIEAGGIETAAKEAGYPVLKIDTDYSMEDIGQLSSREVYRLTKQVFLRLDCGFRLSGVRFFACRGRIVNYWIM